MDEEELAWRRYSKNVDVYTTFMNIVIKINLFYYGITGALLSYYFSNSGNHYELKYALWLPALFSIGLILLFLYGHWAVIKTKEDIEDCKNTLKMNRWVSVDTLIYTIRGSIFFFAVSFIGIFYVLFNKCL